MSLFAHQDAMVSYTRGCALRTSPNARERGHRAVSARRRPLETLPAPRGLEIPPTSAAVGERATNREDRGQGSVESVQHRAARR